MAFIFSPSQIIARSFDVFEPKPNKTWSFYSNVILNVKMEHLVLQLRFKIVRLYASYAPTLSTHIFKKNFLFAKTADTKNVEKSK